MAIFVTKLKCRQGYQTEEPNARPDSGNFRKGALLRAVCGQTGRGCCQQTGMLRAVQVRWSWDRRGSKPGRRRRGSKEQAESKSGADVGRSQAEGDGDPGQTETTAGEGTWTQTKAGQTQT